MAIAALVVGIVGLVLLPLVLGAGALILASMAGKRIKQTGGALTGENLVRAARVIGIVDILLAIVIVIILAAD